MSEIDKPTPAPADGPAAATWHDWANRTTAILAVLAALSSGRWGASNLQAILEQGKVNDTWAYYQAKSIKEHNAQETRDLVAALDHPLSPRSHAMEQLQRKLDEEAQHESADKAKMFDQARAYERFRDSLVERSFWFEVSFAALQLGVILCTIATGAKTPAAWLVGIAFGVIGILLLINGFFRVVHAPKSFYESSSAQMAAKIEPATMPATAPTAPPADR